MTPPGGRAARIARRHRWPAVASLALLAAALGAATLWVPWRAAARQAEIARALTGGDPQRAPALIRRFGCGGCHAIPGIGGADGQVGPSLANLRQRVFIGGGVRNTPDDLVRWIVEPRRLAPHAAMPVTGIDEDEARDVAAYLYAQ